MNTLVSLARKNEKKLFEVCFMGALLLQQVSPCGCSAERAESQWIMQLGLLGERPMYYIQAPIFKHKSEEMYICILLFNAYCLYAVKYRIWNPLVFLSRDRSK